MRIILKDGRSIYNVFNAEVKPDKVTYEDELGIKREISQSKIRLLTYSAIDTKQAQEKPLPWYIRLMDWFGEGFKYYPL